MYGRLIHLRGTRAKHAVIVRIPSIALPRCAADFSDGITSGSRSWPPRWPRRAMMARVKTRNQLNQTMFFTSNTSIYSLRMKTPGTRIPCA